MVAACGFILFYVAGSASVFQAAFPPYGLASVAFTGLSCYFIYSGLYSSAATVSQDSVLRQSIRKTLATQSNLLDSIGTAQMTQELQGAVLKVAKKTSETIEQETGVQPSMTEDDIKDSTWMRFWQKLRAARRDVTVLARDMRQAATRTLQYASLQRVVWTQTE
jgi:hypothetical protein